MIHSDRSFKTYSGLAQGDKPWPTFIFITKEIDFSTVDWTTYASHLTDLNTNASAGSMFRHLGLTDENIYGVYAPGEILVGRNLDATSGSEARTEYTCATASSVLTFTSRLDSAPVQCLILVQQGNTATKLQNNATTDQVHGATALLRDTSIISASVGLRDSDAEVILLADEFKKGQEYRISDFSFAFNWYKD